MKSKLVLGCLLPLCIAAYFYLGGMQTADAAPSIIGSSWLAAQSAYTLSVWQDPLIVSSVYLPLVSIYQDGRQSLNSEKRMGDNPEGEGSEAGCGNLVSCVCSQYTLCNQRTTGCGVRTFLPGDKKKCTWLTVVGV